MKDRMIRTLQASAPVAEAAAVVERAGAVIIEAGRCAGS